MVGAEGAGHLQEQSGASGLAVGFVAVLAAVGLAASAVSLATGDFETSGHRWVAVAGVVLGAIGLLAAGRLLRRLERLPRRIGELEFESTLVVARIRRTTAQGGLLSASLESEATSLYGRLVEAKMLNEAADLLHAVEGVARAR